MKILHTLLVFCFLLSSFSFKLVISSQEYNSYENVKHDFHMSVINIDHNITTKSLEITVKIFTDDFEKSLKEENNTTIKLDGIKETKNNDDYVKSYLNEHFELRVNDDVKNFEYLGKEVELEATWCYLEVMNVEDIKEIKANCTLLIDSFDDQKNIIHVKANKKKQSLLLSKKKNKGEIKY